MTPISLDQFQFYQFFQTFSKNMSMSLLLYDTQSGLDPIILVKLL